MKFLSRRTILLMKDRVPLTRECEKHISIIVYMYFLMYMIGLLVRLGLISVSHKLVQHLKLKQSSGLVVLDQCVSLWSSLVYFCYRGKRFCWVQLLGDNVLHHSHDRRGLIIYSIYRLYCYCQNNVNTQ